MKRKFKKPNYSKREDNFGTGVMILILIFLGFVLFAIGANIYKNYVCEDEPEPAAAAFRRMPEEFFEKKEDLVKLDPRMIEQFLKSNN